MHTTVLHTQKQKYLALIFSISFLFVSFFSLFYIAREEIHDCSGEDCPVCACIHQAEQNLKDLGTGMAVSSGLELFFQTDCILLPLCLCYIPCATLVTQNVRLND